MSCRRRHRLLPARSAVLVFFVLAVFVAPAAVSARLAADAVVCGQVISTDTTYDGSTLSLYVNGSLASSTAVGGSMAATIGPSGSATTPSGRSSSRARSTRSASTSARFPQVRSRRI
jgi:hypothetical protein